MSLSPQISAFINFISDPIKESITFKVNHMIRWFNICWKAIWSWMFLFNFEGRERRTSRMGISAYERHHRVSQVPTTPIYPEANPPMLTFMSRSQILAKTQVEPLYSDPIPGGVQAAAAVATSSCSTSPLSPMKMHRNEPIYATLSETLTSSCNTFDSFNATPSQQISQVIIFTSVVTISKPKFFLT